MTRTLRALCCCALGFLLPAVHSNAQTFYRSYNITSPNSGGIEHVLKTSDGGYLMLGSSVNDELVIKTNSAGSVMWSKKLDGSNFMLNAIEASNGGYFILYFTGNQEGVLKLSATGNVMFAKTYVQTSSAAINSFGFCPTYDGGFLMGGGNCGLVNYISKCDSAGNFVWGKQFKNSYSPGTHTVHKIIQSAAGKYMALCDDPTANDGGYACFEFDGSTGQISWYKKYMPTPNDYHFPLQIVKHGKGYLIATAWKRQSATETDYLTQIDASGNPQWTKTYSRPNKLQTAAMAVNDRGDIMIAGSEVTNNLPRYLYYMTDSSGVVQWGKQSANITLQGAWGDNFLDVANAGTSFLLAGGTSGERLTAAMVTSSGAGMCNNTPVTITSGTATATVTQPTITPVTFTLTATAITQTITSATMHDSVFCSQGLDVATTQMPEANIYPNPAGSRIFIDAANGVWQRAVLQDISGRTIAAVAQNGRTATFDVSGIAEGMYLVVLYNDNNAVVSRQKMIVRH